MAGTRPAYSQGHYHLTDDPTLVPALGDLISPSCLRKIMNGRVIGDSIMNGRVIGSFGRVWWLLRPTASACSWTYLQGSVP